MLICLIEYARHKMVSVFNTTLSISANISAAFDKIPLIIGGGEGGGVKYSYTEQLNRVG